MPKEIVIAVSFVPATDIFDSGNVLFIAKQNFTFIGRLYVWKSSWMV